MGSPCSLGPTVTYRLEGTTAVLTIDRPEKRNALDQTTVNALGDFFTDPPGEVKAAVLTTSGEHFSAGVDLNELKENDAVEGVAHSQSWRAPFNAIQMGRVPVVAALRGAVIGGGLELALCAHIRVADTTAYYALPEGSRGIFVGGGAAVRLPRVIGVAAMMDLMLTGRVLDATEGQHRGISQYLVDQGQAEARARELAERIGKNAAVSNYAILQAVPRIAEMGPNEGLFVESLMAGITGSTDDAHNMLKAFLAGRAAKVGQAEQAGTASSEAGDSEDAAASNGH